MSEQEQSRMLAQEQAERVVQRLMRRYSADTHQPVPPSALDSAFRDWLGLASGMPPAELTRASTEQADTRLIPLDVSRQRLCVALRTTDGAIALVLADPFDRDHRLWLEARLRDAGHPRTRWYVTPVQALLGFIDRIEQTRLADEALRTGVCQPGRDTPTETAALRHINAVLRQALGAHATHLHWLQAEQASDNTPRPAQGVWRMRVEGILRRTATTEEGSSSFNAVFETLQAAATRDGHLSVVHAGRQWMAHITVLQRAGSDGNVQRAAVLRLPAVSTPHRHPGLDELGHDSGTLERLRHSLQLAHGLWLVVSPPGAGKSQTLLALSRELGAGGQRILLLERPTVSELAEALAQDPDRLLIDEADTPGAVARLADELLTGQPIVLGMAAPDPWSALMRLERLGLPAAVLAVTLKGVLVQSLLRLNCPSCSRPVAPVRTGHPAYVRGAGCPDCDHTGQVGRQVISRWLALTPPLADLLATPAPYRALQAAASREGYTGLQDAALEWVTAGLVSLEEARRVAALAL
jgi:general secretion pathway protein E